MGLSAFADIARAAVEAPAAHLAAGCLSSGDGYLKARLKGRIEATIDWPNAGLRCEGEERPNHEGLRLSFHREPASAPDLLFVFGITRVGENQRATGTPVNVTVILQDSTLMFGTRGDSRCTIDSLQQRRLPEPAPARRYRIEAHGFCTSPAHAIRGEGSVLLTSFDFAGSVLFDGQEHTT
ncbi:MAG: hypothetical protein U1F35_20560 [Steroidobacteraceae bacterium]